MKFRRYERDVSWSAGPAVLRESPETGKAAALDHALPMSAPVEHMLVVTDFTECTNSAIARAMERGRALGAQVTLLHVVEEEFSRKKRRLRQREARVLLTEHAASLCRDTHSDVSVSVRIGEPHLEIIREAIDLGSDAIILGVERRGLIDQKAAAIAVEVVRYSGKPVLIVAHRPTAPYGHAVVDLGPSVALSTTVRAARRFAPQAKPHVVHIAPTLATEHSAPESDAVSDKPLVEVADCISHIGADLLVLSSNGAPQLANNNLRSLIRRVAESGRCDLLFVRSQ